MRAAPAGAIPLQELDDTQNWRFKSLTISGNEKVPTSDLEAAISTHSRPWYALWRPLPAFDPGVFASDLQLIADLYRDRGYFEAKVSHDLAVDPDEKLVSAKIEITEGDPVRVRELSVDLVDAPELKSDLDALLPKLPLQVGKIFAVDDYQRSESQLKGFFYDHGRARVQIQRKAQVILDQHEARVFYTLTAGPPTKFGETTVEGLKSVQESVVRAELTYEKGQEFSGGALRNTERNLRELDLFSRIEITPDTSPADPTIVPVRIGVDEKPPREIRIGVGYGTEDQLRGQIRWRSNNFFGGGRRLEIGAKASFITRELNFNFLQPHFLDPKNKLLINFGPQEFVEPGYTQNATRLRPSIERHFTDRLTGYIAYRVEYDKLSKVSDATAEALRDFQNKGLLSGLSAGFTWNKANDPLNPTNGFILSFVGEQVGGPLGGKFNFFKLQSQITGYYPLAEQTVFASRLKLGFAEPLHADEDVPLFERFYAGGTNSVRGYARSKLGPLSASNDPIGGRSLIEGSLELRQHLYKEIGGAVFLDFGQVSRRSFDLPIGDLQFSAGVGVRYTTPVGPLRFDIGFPFHAPPGDRSWQIHFSIGQFF